MVSTFRLPPHPSASSPLHFLLPVHQSLSVLPLITFQIPPSSFTNFSLWSHLYPSSLPLWGSGFPPSLESPPLRRQSSFRPPGSSTEPPVSPPPYPPLLSVCGLLLLDSKNTNISTFEPPLLTYPFNSTADSGLSTSILYSPVINLWSPPIQ